MSRLELDTEDRETYQWLISAIRSLGFMGLIETDELKRYVWIGRKT